MLRTTQRLCAFLAGCLLLTIGEPKVQAVQFRVSSQTVGDAYQLVTADEELLNRRRIHQYLRMGAYDLLSDGTYSLSLHTLLRLDTGLGISQPELDRITGSQRHKLSVQVAFVEARKLLGRSDFNIDFKIGRFLHADALDFLMLDGGTVTFRTPWHVGVQLLGGLESRDGSSALTRSQFALDGARIFETDEFIDAPSIAVGAALLLTDMAQSRAKLSYRRLFSYQKASRLVNRDGAIVSEALTLHEGSPSEKVQGVDSEKVGFAFFQNFSGAVDLSSALSYDLFNAVIDQTKVLTRWRMTDAWELSGQYVRLIPTFDADSIFNIFSVQPLNDVNVRLRWHLSNRQRVYAAGMVRLFGNEPAEAGQADMPDTVKAYGAMAGYYHGFGETGRMGVDLSAELGFGGRRILVDVFGMWAPLPRTLELDGRLTVVDFAEDLQPNLKGTSIGYQLGAKVLLGENAGLSVVVEHNFSKIHAQQFRLFALVDMDVWL